MKKEFDKIYYFDDTCNQDCWFYSIVWVTPGQIENIRNVLFQAKADIDLKRNASPGKGELATTWVPYYKEYNTLENMKKFHNSI